MPDFDIVRIRVPYRAALTFRGEARELRVDKAFDVPVASVFVRNVRVISVLWTNGRTSSGTRMRKVLYATWDNAA